LLDSRSFLASRKASLNELCKQEVTGSIPVGSLANRLKNRGIQDCRLPKGAAAEPSQKRRRRHERIVASPSSSVDAVVNAADQALY
jgi:hypothetical protein